jgi:LytS/YehU family sensor histidine kinase
MILDASNKDLIPVSKNKMALELYIQLQQLRYNKKFIYKMNFDRNLTSADQKVPPLLIQPYIEDAITNSIAPSDKKDLELSIKARIDNDHIIYTIKDNGIPRKIHLIFLQQDHPDESIAETRVYDGTVHILNNQNQLSRDVFVKDLYDEYGKPCGTVVEVKLKVS